MSTMQNKNYYEVLGVSKTASVEEIRHAFQKKARTLHPDVNKEPDAEARFKEVSEAYAVLSDPDKRQHYDAIRRGAFPFPGAGSAATAAHGAPDFGFGGFSPTWDVYAKQPAYKPERGQDVSVSLNLTREEAKQGCSKGFSYDAFVRCDVCDGSGSKDDAEPAVCNMCHGTGRMEIDLSQLMGLGLGAMQMLCPQCEGSGRVVSDPCERCGGSGRYMGASEAVVEIDPHTQDESLIVKKGAGNAGTNRTEAGNLNIRINIPEEKLSPESQRGFSLIGFALPFLLVGLYFNELVVMSVLVSVGVLIGFVLVLKEGFLKRGKSWWKHGGKAILRGIETGLFCALLVGFLVSCGSNSYNNIASYHNHF